MDHGSIAASVLKKLQVRRYIVMNADHAHIQVTDSAGHAEINCAPDRKGAALFSSHPIPDLPPKWIQRQQINTIALPRISLHERYRFLHHGSIIYQWQVH